MAKNWLHLFDSGIVQDYPGDHVRQLHELAQKTDEDWRRHSPPGATPSPPPPAA